MVPLILMLVITKTAAFLKALIDFDPHKNSTTHNSSIKMGASDFNARRFKPY